MAESENRPKTAIFPGKVGKVLCVNVQDRTLVQNNKNKTVRFLNGLVFQFISFDGCRPNVLLSAAFPVCRVEACQTHQIPNLAAAGDGRDAGDNGGDNPRYRYNPRYLYNHCR